MTCLRPGEAARAIDDGNAVSVDDGRPLQEADRRQGDVVGGAADRPFHWLPSTDVRREGID